MSGLSETDTARRCIAWVFPCHWMKQESVSTSAVGDMFGKQAQQIALLVRHRWHRCFPSDVRAFQAQEYNAQQASLEAGESERTGGVASHKVYLFR